MQLRTAALTLTLTELDELHQAIVDACTSEPVRLESYCRHYVSIVLNVVLPLIKDVYGLSEHRQLEQLDEAFVRVIAKLDSIGEYARALGRDQASVRRECESLWRAMFLHAQVSRIAARTAR